MLRFNIRDVLWLTAVIALAIAWRAESLHLRRQLEDARNQATKMQLDYERAMSLRSGLADP
jgi:hypothetical protein